MVGHPDLGRTGRRAAAGYWDGTCRQAAAGAATLAGSGLGLDADASGCGNPRWRREADGGGATEALFL